MSNITLSKNTIKKGVVVLPLESYQELLRQVVPTHYLTGSKASKIDKLVQEGLRDLASGRTKKVKSLADLK